MFLVLNEKLNKKSNFRPQLTSTRPMRAELGPNEEKA